MITLCCILSAHKASQFAGRQLGGSKILLVVGGHMLTWRWVRCNCLLQVVFEYVDKEKRCYWCLSLIMIGCLKPTKGVRKAHQTIPGLALIVSVGFPDKLQGIMKKPQEAYFVNIDQCRAISYSKLNLP